MIFVDNFSSFAQAYPLKTESAIEAVKAFQQFTKHYGLMHTLLADNATCFKSTLFNSFLNDRQVKIQFTSVNQHQSNKAEQFMLPVRTSVRKKMLDLQNLNTSEITTITNPFHGVKKENDVQWSDVIHESLNVHNHLPTKYETPNRKELYSPGQIFNNCSYRPFVHKPIMMKETHRLSSTIIDLDHVLAAKLYKLSNKPIDAPPKFRFVVGDVVIILTLKATKNTRNFRSHELLQVVGVDGATCTVRQYRRPLDEQESFVVHGNLLQKIDLKNMILNGNAIQEPEPNQKFYNKQTTNTEAHEGKSSVY